MKLVAHNTNTRVTPRVGISIHHAGRNDYRLSLDGIGEYGAYSQLGQAASKSQWLARLNQSDLNWEIAKVQTLNDNRQGVTQ